MATNGLGLTPPLHLVNKNMYLHLLYRVKTFIGLKRKWHFRQHAKGIFRI